jgi:uncharacterized Zn-binding protein involved in type VI secretion
MASELYHVGATTLCPHGGNASTISSNTRVKVSGMAVATLSDVTMVAGCPFAVPPPKGPQPCVKVQWLTPATRVRVMGNPVLLKTSTGLCQSAEQIPQGPPTVVATQIRAKGT